MSRTGRTEAQVSLELILDITGIIQPAEPDVGISEPYVDDVDLEDAYTEHRKFNSDTGRTVTVRSISLFEGVDTSNPQVRKLIDNLLTLTGEDYMADELMESAS